MQQSLTANPHELAEAFGQIGNGFLRLAKALDEREDAPVRELEYVPLEEVEHPQDKPKAQTPRAALKAVPKAAPVVEVELEPVTERGEPLPLRQEWVEQLEAEPEADDPLPEFAQRETETPEEYEAERQSLITELKSLAAEFCELTDKDVDIEWRAFVANKEPYDKPRPWLREGIERARANVAKARANVSPLVLTEKQAKEMPGQVVSGKQKKLRQNEAGEAEAVLFDPNDSAPGPYKKAYDQFHALFEQHRAAGQDYSTVRDKVEASVHNKRFKNFGELDAADLARATHALNNWNPEADARLAKKGAKK